MSYGSWAADGASRGCEGAATPTAESTAKRPLPFDPVPRWPRESACARRPGKRRVISRHTSPPTRRSNCPFYARTASSGGPSLHYGRQLKERTREGYRCAVKFEPNYATRSVVSWGHIEDRCAWYATAASSVEAGTDPAIQSLVNHFILRSLSTHLRARPHSPATELIAQEGWSIHGGATSTTPE